jgi:hypothetical protein
MPDLGGNDRHLSQPRSNTMNAAKNSLLFLLLVASTFGQNPPEAGDPYRARGVARSPDGSYEWTVKVGAPLGYELLQLPARTPILTVPAYFSEADPENVRYAKAMGVFWNSAGNLVVLDELNRRRSGHIYFFSIDNGKAKMLSVAKSIPIPATADEARLVVDPGWVSPTKIRTRLSLKNKEGGFESKFYSIDFVDPQKPKVELTK